MTGRDLKRIRLDLGWSQEEMAQYLFRSQSRVSRWERTEDKPLDPLVAERLARVGHPDPQPQGTQ